MKYRPMQVGDAYFIFVVRNPKRAEENVPCCLVCINGVPLLRTNRIKQSFLNIVRQINDEEYIVIAHLEDGDFVHVVYDETKEGNQEHYWGRFENWSIRYMPKAEYKELRGQPYKGDMG